MPCTNHPEVMDGLNRCGRCSQWFCGDCLVELKGDRYCAGCKGEQVKDLKSGVQSGELELAGIGARFAAQFLDGLVLAVVWIPLAVVLGMFAVQAEKAGGSGANPFGGLQLALMLVILGVNVMYEGTMLQWRGQTLGKMALRIKVVTPEGGSISAGQAWIRPLVRGFLGCLWLLGVLVDYVPAFITQKKTCVHDMAAKTRVVRLQG